MLAIHPVADGNGRVARILTSQMLLGAARASLHRTTNLRHEGHLLRRSLPVAANGNGGRDTIWPWTSYLVETLAEPTPHSSSGSQPSDLGNGQ